MEHFTQHSHITLRITGYHRPTVSEPPPERTVLEYICSVSSRKKESTWTVILVVERNCP